MLRTKIRILSVVTLVMLLSIGGFNVYAAGIVVRGKSQEWFWIIPVSLLSELMLSWKAPRTSEQ